MMHPATRLLCLALVRHGKGILSEVEKWLAATESSTLSSQPRGSADAPADDESAIASSTPPRAFPRR